jgi:hypothetical protein
MSRDGQPRPPGPPSTVAAPRAGIDAVVLRRSARALHAYLVREATRSDWSPLAAARRLTDYARVDLMILRRTHAELLRVGHQYPVLVQRRALVTILIAIADLEESTQRGQGDTGHYGAEAANAAGLGTVAAAASMECPGWAT